MVRIDESAPSRVALLGAGVIGAGWAARFLLNGVDVEVFDPDPQSRDRVAATLENARWAQSNLTILPSLSEGALHFARSLEEAVSEADFIQESAPERETLKRSLLEASIGSRQFRGHHRLIHLRHQTQPFAGRLPITRKNLCRTSFQSRVSTTACGSGRWRIN